MKTCYHNPAHLPVMGVLGKQRICAFKLEFFLKILSMTFLPLLFQGHLSYALYHVPVSVSAPFLDVCGSEIC